VGFIPDFMLLLLKVGKGQSVLIKQTIKVYSKEMHRVLLVHIIICLTDYAFSGATKKLIFLRK